MRGLLTCCRWTWSSVCASSCTKFLQKECNCIFTFWASRLGQFVFADCSRMIRLMLYYDFGTTHPHNPHPVHDETLVSNFGCRLRIPSSGTPLLTRR